MVTDKQRKFVLFMIKIGLWKQTTHMRITEIETCCGTHWIFNWILKRQVVDSYHHAPCCEANHYHNKRLVFFRCDCGAEYYAQAEAQKAAGRLPTYQLTGHKL